MRPDTKTKVIVSVAYDIESRCESGGNCESKSVRTIAVARRTDLQQDNIRSLYMPLVYIRFMSAAFSNSSGKSRLE